MEKQDEFELVPMSPIRRLERRLEHIESTSGTDSKGVLAEMIDIIKMNQMLVDELAKANDALRIEVSRLPGKMEELINHLTELLAYIKASAVDEAVPSSAFKPLTDKFDQLIETNRKIAEGNQNMISALEEIDKKLKRPAVPMMAPRPMQQPVKLVPPQPLPARPIQ
jgi:hypothetical protein